MKEFNFKLTEDKINQILATLAKEPYREVVELIQDIHLQANEQMKPENVQVVK